MLGLPRWCDGKGSTCQCRRSRDLGSIFGLGRSHGEGNGNPLQHSCLENPWTEEPGGLQSVGLPKSWAWLSDWVRMQCVYATGNSQNGTGRCGYSQFIFSLFSWCTKWCCNKWNWLCEGRGKAQVWLHEKEWDYDTSWTMSGSRENIWGWPQWTSSEQGPQAILSCHLQGPL